MEKNTITEKVIKAAVKHLKEAAQNIDGYTYVYPSNNEGKRLVIHGWVTPWEASVMFANVLNGDKKVEDYPEMKEIEMPKLGDGIKYATIDDMDDLLNV